MITQIRNRADGMSKTGQRIAAFILKDPSAIARMSIQECAAGAEVAPSAVIRFCKALGVSGFSELKLQLAQATFERPTEEQLPNIAPGDSARSVFQKVFQSGKHTLEDTLRILDLDRMEEICELFEAAHRICFFGVGTSSVIATDAQYRFSQLGLSATASTDIVFMNVAAVNLSRGDLAVGISHSGNTRATVDCLRHAKEAGAAALAITSFSESLLARECDRSLVAYSDAQNYPVEAVSARLAHLCIIDALVMCLASRGYQALPEHLNKRNRILNTIRY